MLHYYKKLIALRRNPDYADALVEGRFVPADAYMEEHPDIFAFYREGESQRVLVISNWGKERVTVPVKEGKSLEKLLGSFDFAVDACVGATEKNKDVCQSIVLESGQICIYSVRK